MRRSSAVLACSLAGRAGTRSGQGHKAGQAGEAQDGARRPRRRGVRGGREVLPLLGRDDRAAALPLPAARRRRALAAAAADRRHARRQGRADLLLGHPERVVRSRDAGADPAQRAARGPRLARHRPARSRRQRARDPPLRLDPPLQRARRHDPAQQLHALRRPRPRLHQLRHPLPLVAPRPDRGQQLPRLPRLRLHPRALRHAPDDPAQPVRPLAPVPDERVPVRAPGPRPVLRGPAPAGRRQPLRRLQERRRSALPDEQRRLRDDRQQRLRRHGSARSRLPRADGDRDRQQRVTAAPPLREGRQQHDPLRRGTAGRVRGLDPDELEVQRRCRSGSGRSSRTT